MPTPETRAAACRHHSVRASGAVTPWARYGNRHGGSGVRAWRLEGDLLSVEFVDGAVYDYRRRDVGARAFDAACAAARAGRGLSGCISRLLRDGYAARYDDRRAWSAAHGGRERGSGWPEAK